MTEVVAGTGGVVKAEPAGQVTGIRGQKSFGQSGLPGSTQMSGQAWKAKEVVVV